MSAADFVFTPSVSTERVSRRELCTHPLVWRAVRGMFSLYATFSFAVLFLAEDIAQSTHLPAFCAAVGLVTLWLGVTEAPRLGTLRNHVVVALPALAVSAAVLLVPTVSTIVLGGAFFIGPLIAVRLQERRHIVLHMGLAALLLGSATVGAGASSSVVLTAIVVGVASAILCLCCTVILEAAEAQGDELEGLVRRDPLTGVGNRRLLLEVLASESRRHANTGHTLAVIAMDLNGFKGINDTFGHAAGDELLQRVAGALIEVVPHEATVVRQGGDEFCVVLPDSNPASAERVATAIRTGLAAVTVDRHAAVSTGIGMALFPDDAPDADTLLQVADERLYLDKQPSSLRA